MPEERPPLLLSFATGQSDPRGHALSPVQQAFLDRLPVPAAFKLARNFPWREATPPFRETALLPASFFNLRQFFAAQHASFARRHRADVAAWAARAEHHLVFAGSCGLELLRRLELPAELWPRLSVFAYGPVVCGKVPWRVFTVQGRFDFISKPFVRRPDVVVAAGHLDYLESPEVLAWAHTFLRQVLAEVGHP